MTVEYVLGIDSGATKYLITACDLEGRALATYTGAPSAHFRVTPEQMVERINAAVDACLAQFDGDRADCQWIVCGAAGIDYPEAREFVSGIYRDLAGFDCPIHCVNDAEVANYAATGGIGVVVIAGTGSIAFGRSPAGETASTGGWPICIFGDEGSGAWIARKALAHLAQWFDGLVPDGPLVEALRELLAVRDRGDLMAICSEIDYQRWVDPGVAGVVSSCAEAGDPAAGSLIDAAADATFALGDRIVQRLALSELEEFRVGAWGSAITKSPRHLERFTALFLARYGNVRVLVADEDAAMGACRMALALRQGEPVPAG